MVDHPGLVQDYCRVPALIAAGVNAKALSVIMGHATISMTFDVYGHMMPGGLEAAAATANAYLAAAGKRPALRVAG